MSASSIFRIGWRRSRIWPIELSCCATVRMLENLGRDEIDHEAMVRIDGGPRCVAGSMPAKNTRWEMPLLNVHKRLVTPTWPQHKLSFSVQAPVKWWGWPVWSAPGVPNCCALCSELNRHWLGARSKLAGRVAFACRDSSEAISPRHGVGSRRSQAAWSGSGDVGSSQYRVWPACAAFAVRSLGFLNQRQEDDRHSSG